jgi:hypothetical protein
MSKFQLLRCEIALGGDREQIVARHRSNPVVFPEMLVLQHLHGEDAVQDVAVVGEWDASNDQVLERLRSIYPAKAISDVFPGTKPKLPFGDGTIPICRRPQHIAPPTLPDNPDPVARPLDASSVPAVPAPVPDLPDRPLTEEEAQAEMTRMFGDQFDGVEAAAPGQITQETDRQFVQRTVASAIQGVMPQPKPDMPDPASYRARDNIRGEGPKAPRTADHMPDVAGGSLRDASARDRRNRTGGPPA